MNLIHPVLTYLSSSLTDTRCKSAEQSTVIIQNNHLSLLYSRKAVRQSKAACSVWASQTTREQIWQSCNLFSSCDNRLLVLVDRSTFSEQDEGFDRKILPVWILSCSTNWRFRMKLFSQKEHLCGLTPVNVTNLSFKVNCTKITKKNSPVWDISCRVRFAWWANVLSQYLHFQGFVPVWVRMWYWRWYFP